MWRNQQQCSCQCRLVHSSAGMHDPSCRLFQYQNPTNIWDQSVCLRPTLLDTLPIVNRRASTVEPVHTVIHPRHQHGHLPYGSTLDSIPRINPACTMQAKEQSKHLWSLARDSELDAIGRPRNPILYCGRPTNATDLDLPTNNSIPNIRHRHVLRDPISTTASTTSASSTIPIDRSQPSRCLGRQASTGRRRSSSLRRR